MGDLILMTRPQAAPRERPARDGSAEILFFTGVRYYRMTEEVPSQTIVRRRRPEKAKKAVEARRLRHDALSEPASA